MIRILLVDDQPLARTGLRAILCEDEGFLVVGECADGDEVLQAVRDGQPQVIVMDVRMPRMNGAEATRQLRERIAEAPPVLILTTFQDEEVLSSALRAGASGFLLKDAPGEEILRAARTLAAGGAYLDPAVTGRVLAAYRESPPERTESALPDLTQRELEVLRLVGRGLSNEEIGARLVIGEGTVKTHVGRIFDKLGVRDRPAAIVFAFDYGVVRAEL